MKHIKEFVEFINENSINETSLEKNLINNISKAIKKRNPKIDSKIIYDKVKYWINNGKNLMTATNSYGDNYTKDVLTPIEKLLNESSIHNFAANKIDGKIDFLLNGDYDKDVEMLNDLKDAINRFALTPKRKKALMYIDDKLKKA